MNKIHSVTLVSDGILVNFDNGTNCYYPASFLLDNVENGVTHLFLDHDPSAQNLYMTGPGIADQAVASVAN